jgi:hypothetical protein
MDGRTLSSPNGEANTSDAVVFATGWREPYELMFDPSLARGLGILMPKDTHNLHPTANTGCISTPKPRRKSSPLPYPRTPPENLNLHPKPYRQYSSFFRFMVPLRSPLETTTPSSSSATCTCKAQPSSLRSAPSRPSSTLKISSPLYPPSTAFSQTERRWRKRRQVWSRGRRRGMLISLRCRW